MPFTWHQIIQYSRDIMIFGPPLPRNRLYSELFKGINAISTVRATFMWMAEEVAGDSITGYALLHVYLSEENRLLHKIIHDE